MLFAVCVFALCRFVYLLFAFCLVPVCEFAVCEFAVCFALSGIMTPARIYTGTPSPTPTAAHRHSRRGPRIHGVGAHTGRWLAPWAGVDRPRIPAACPLWCWTRRAS